MFYCEKCRTEREWPESMVQSRGRCEVCGVVATCSDVASRHLPLPKLRVSRVGIPVDPPSAA